MSVSTKSQRQQLCRNKKYIVVRMSDTERDKKKKIEMAEVADVSSARVEDEGEEPSERDRLIEKKNDPP